MNITRCSYCYHIDHENRFQFICIRHVSLSASICFGPYVSHQVYPAYPMASNCGSWSLKYLELQRCITRIFMIIISTVWLCILSDVINVSYIPLVPILVISACMNMKEEKYVLPFPICLSLELLSEP